MRAGFWKKASGLSVSLLLVFLIFSVLVSASAVKLDTGDPSDSHIVVGDTIFFSTVNLMIKGKEVISVDHLIFVIYNNLNHQQVASVNFSVLGDELSDPADAFTVVNVTDTSALPYQGDGSDCDYGYGYGYGYGKLDLTIVYKISYATQSPGKFYAKLFVISNTHTYSSGKSKHFTVLPTSPMNTIFVDIKPGCWPNRITPREHGGVFVAICGTESFDVHTINPKAIELSLDGGKKGVKPLCWRYVDVATPWRGADGDGHAAHGDGYLDLLLIFRNPQYTHLLHLFKHPGETLRLAITGTLKSSSSSLSVAGHDYVQIDDYNNKHKH